MTPTSTPTPTAALPVLAKVLIVGAGIMSLANSVTVPFLAMFLRKELGLQPGMIGFVIGLYFSHGVLAVFVFNAMMALSSSSFGPVGKALLSDLLPPERRVKTFSYQYMAINMGFAVGPVVGAAGYGVYLVGLAGILLEGVHGRISSLLAQHLSDGFADGTVILGYVLTTNAVTVVALQLFVSRFMERRNPVTAIVVGGLLTVVGMAGFAFSEEFWHFVVAMVVFSLGEILIYPAEFAIIDRIAPEERRGAYFGAQTFAQLGVFVGPFTGGLLLAAYDGTTMFLGVGCLALAGVVIYLLVGRRVPGLGTSGPDRLLERPKEEHADEVA